MSIILQRRRDVRSSINSNERLDRGFNTFIIFVLVVNMILILYAMLSVTIRMTLSGVSLVDSMPIALYILPLMIFLPFMIQSFHNDRAAVWNLIFLVISSIFFGLLTLLIRGFLFSLIFNLVAIILLFFLGRFRPKSNFRQAGKKAIAYIILLNMLGFSFPVSVIIMGEVPIASVSNTGSSYTMFEVPLADFDYPYTNITPTQSLLNDVLVNQFGLDIRVQENSSESWSRLQTWIGALNLTSVPYIITLSSDRASMIGSHPTSLGTTEVIHEMFVSHNDALEQVSTELVGVMNRPLKLQYDFTLSRIEWQQLMLYTRNLDLVGFAGLMRSSIFSIDPTVIEEDTAELIQASDEANLKAGVLVESFAIDDFQDGDTLTMRLCGVTADTLSLWNSVEISCERSRFSFEMLGDVGEYLAYSYASSLRTIGSTWSIKLGEIGNSTDIDGRIDSVYTTMQIFVNDLISASNHGLTNLTIASLPSLLTTFGSDAIGTLRAIMLVTADSQVTYTFRIYAYRAVFFAIDSFDVLMF